MTSTELTTAVNTCLANHLEAKYWSGLASDTKSGAISMALNDVLAEIPGLTLSSLKSGSFAVYAVAEQAVYLLQNYHLIKNAKITTSEGVEGVNASYAVINQRFSMSPRASAFIHKAKMAYFGASAPISRG